MYRLVVLMCALALSCAMPNGTKRLLLADKFEGLETTTQSFIQSLEGLISSTEQEINVFVLNKKCIQLEAGAAKVAKKIAQAETKLGIKSGYETEEQELAAATSKLMKIVKSQKITAEDMLGLIIGEGNMAVDHLRLTMSIDLLDKMKVDALQTDLNMLKNASNPQEARQALDELKVSLDGVSTILDGITTIVEDAVMTAKKQLGPKRSSEESSDESSETEPENMDSDKSSWFDGWFNDESDERDGRSRSVENDRVRHRVRRQSWGNLGRGWRVDLGGLHYRRDNLHFNAKPIFDGWRPSGASLSFNWRFK